MYGTNAVFPSSAEVLHPVDGARPPAVFTRWMKVVTVSAPPPVGPFWTPALFRRSHGIASGATKLGSDEGDVLTGPADVLLARLVARADERGIVTVAAAAEEGDTPGFPASRPEVIAVLGSDDGGGVRLPAWTAHASAVAAPGVDVLTTVPRDGWDFLSGSSLAAAHVTGVVALLLEERPRLRAAEARALLERTARADAAGARPASGAVALVDACAALARLRGVATCP